MDKKTILIIDDQQDTQVLLKKRLEVAGYAVEQAWDGKDGFWKVFEHKPDLILLDVLMPEMNGIEFVSRLREVDQKHTIPVIVISKRALIVNCFDEETIEGFFPKPIDMNGLLKKIEEVLKREEALTFLKELEDKKKEEAPETTIKQKVKRRVKREVCKRCAYVLSEDDEFRERCPNCGYPDFFVEETFE